MAVKRDQEDVDDNLAYNFVPISSNPTIALMSQSMASIHRSSPYPPTSSPISPPNSPYSSSQSSSDHRQRETTRKQKRKKSEARRSKQQNQQSNDNHNFAPLSQSEKVMFSSFQKNPEEDEHNFKDEPFKSERFSNYKSNNNYKKSNEEVRSNREMGGRDIVFLGRNYNRYQEEKSDDINGKINHESSTEGSSSLSISRPIESPQEETELVDEEQARINKEILFPLFDTILSQSESRNQESKLSLN